ncbi:disease resistance protein RPV1-like isoform X3 [Carya illinoinensis]|uniref:disease resistance protein RPV1-like isoform X3 n=1 Tax=Carya illinoinensis TaxID=32201 RepID=UPI001C7236DB|nr:disease resistance protein RPV1-like isoform X3 [Carya illinoinensis]
MAFHGGSSSSSFPTSSSLSPQWTYDVFLSFRGEDTRNNFTAHLHNALHRKGVITYIDDKLRRGEEISQALLRAIEESRISITVLSKNYASSTWCLDELTKILECRKTKQQMVLPVFYNVDPSEVRHQTKSFGEALAKLEERLKDSARVQRWKACLKEVANLSGWHLGENGSESKFIQEITQAVTRIVNRTYLNVAKHPIGVESRVHAINMLLSVGMNDIRMIGVFGVGGIGKTTITKAIYNLNAYQFEDSCFLANVRETSKREFGLVQLQEKLLYDILGESSLKVDNVDRGINIIKERLCSKRILLVLDDVDQLAQLEALSGESGWVGLGSRIIITTRDKHLLTKHQVGLTYKVKEMDHNEALQLFSWHAFKKDKPIDGFVQLSEHALRCARGLPLALVVLGSDIYGRSLHEWKSALDKCKRLPNKNIHKILRISYDDLDDNEKDIFLDIACFFKGKDADYVIKILDSCGFFPDIGIRVLTDKSLIAIEENNRLVMHDLIQEMGREIVRQESPKEPGRRSRLWFHGDVRYVLEENEGTNKIEGILVELPKRDLIHLSSKAFTKMKRLLLFINRNACFSGGPNYLSNELRLLDWPEYPLQALPSNFHGKKLSVFRISHSLFKELKEVFENFQNMKIMELSDCKFLTKIPDISRIPSLEKLTLSSCESLVEVHDSVGYLNKLTHLSFSKCSNLITLPRSLKLRSLEWLDIIECLSLQNFPEIECEMDCLSSISLAYTAIKELPSSIGYITGLEDLCLDGCKNLLNLPSSILQLQNLWSLSFKDRYPGKVRNKRQSIPSFVSTEGSEILSGVELISLQTPKNSSVSNDDCSSTVFPSLQFLNLGKCVLSESNLFKLFDCSSTLQVLDFSGTDIVSLPASIKRFIGLERLILQDCKQLQEIVELPPNIKEVDASGCMSLENFPEASKKFQFNACNLKALEWIDLGGCHKMLVNIGNHVADPLLGSI